MMKHFKISGYVTFGFEKIVECENIEKANELADLIERARDVDDGDMNDWIDEVAVDDVEELEEE
jgi:hypothetical protein|nr:MAG TPA: hypothetical protein [Caudoviricetes sp.]